MIVAFIQNPNSNPTKLWKNQRATEVYLPFTPGAISKFFLSLFLLSFEILIEFKEFYHVFFAKDKVTKRAEGFSNAEQFSLENCLSPKKILNFKLKI